MLNEEIKKSIEEMVDQALSTETEEVVEETTTEEVIEKSEETPTEEVEKSMPTSLPENGGKDEIKSGTPHSEEQQPKEADSGKKKKKDMKKMCKKSLAELSEHLEKDEIDLLKAWRAENGEIEELAEEAIEKSQPATVDHEAIVKSVSELFKVETEGLKKAISDKDEMIKSLQTTVNKLASQPAYDTKSLTTLETLEKGGQEEAELSKSQVLDKMLELQFAGKGVTSHSVSEFEATGDISNPEIKKLVFDSLKSSK